MGRRDGASSKRRPKAPSPKAPSRVVALQRRRLEMGVEKLVASFRGASAGLACSPFASCLRAGFGFGFFRLCVWRFVSFFRLCVWPGSKTIGVWLLGLLDTRTIRAFGCVPGPNLFVGALSQKRASRVSAIPEAIVAKRPTGTSALQRRPQPEGPLDFPVCFRHRVPSCGFSNFRIFGFSDFRIFGGLFETAPFQGPLITAPLLRATRSLETRSLNRPLLPAPLCGLSTVFFEGHPQCPNTRLPLHKKVRFLETQGGDETSVETFEGGLESHSGRWARQDGRLKGARGHRTHPSRLHRAFGHFRLWDSALGRFWGPHSETRERGRRTTSP
mmetsp:Transcript_8017/g.28486  ORF Transcript_8017/g.28486 Transcript_8017/m.28486 type:complete len:330 (-) Transcript_8017:624-1613(-)